MKQTAPSARRFVMLRASGNNVMRKLEIHGLSVSSARRLSCRCAELWLLRSFVVNNREVPAPAGTVVCDAFALNFKL